MKREFRVVQPEQWVQVGPGKDDDIFSWLGHAVTIPSPICFVTTRKPNGAPCAILNGQGSLQGDKDNYSCSLAVPDNEQTFNNILREGEWCLGFPSFEVQKRCIEIIRLNGFGGDDISADGFTFEPPVVVQAPRVAECSINLECRLEAHRLLSENSGWHVFLGRVVHAALDDDGTNLGPFERMRKMEQMYVDRMKRAQQTGE